MSNQQRILLPMTFIGMVLVSVVIWFTTQAPDPSVVIPLILVCGIYFFLSFFALTEKQAFRQKIPTTRRISGKPFFDEKKRIWLVYGVLFVVFAYYVLILLTRGTIEQTGQTDWGIDQGYTMLFWGMVLVGFILFMLYYKKQTLFRDKLLDRTHFVFWATNFFFIMLSLNIWMWISHSPQINFYHIWNLDNNEQLFDKVTHVFVAFLWTITALAIRPERSTLLIVWGSMALYELIEILVIINFEGTVLDITSETTFDVEVRDVPFDLLANTVGWLAAILLMRKRIKLYHRVRA